MTQKEIKIANCCRHPASANKIISQLEKLAMRKRMDGNDPNRTAYILGDDTQRFLTMKVTEVEMAIMVEHFIENVTNAFYPQYAEMKEFIMEEFVDAKWSNAFKIKEI